MNGKLRYLFLIVILFFSMGCYSQTPKGVAYKVKKKDTIFSIAKKNGLTVVELMDATSWASTTSFNQIGRAHV